MSTFICEKCGCIDNSACGGTFHTYRAKSYNFYKDEYANNHALCVECTPKEFNDGSINETAGKWHNRFPKEHWSKHGTKAELIVEAQKRQGLYTNAVEYFQKLEEKK